MIGKPEWFKRRKYTGWGITPSTWQGWLYIAVILVPFIIFNNLTFLDNKIRVIFSIIWIALVALDVFDIMIRMKKDERERVHEAIAERNALWIMIIVLVIGVGYQAARAAVLKNVWQVDWFLIVALIAGLIAKSVTNFYLDRKD